MMVNPLVRRSVSSDFFCVFYCFKACRNLLLINRTSAVSIDVNFVKAKKWLLSYDEKSVFARNPGAELVL